MFFKKIDYNYNSYLSTLDLLNKYNITEKKKLPFLNRIIIVLPLTLFLDKFIDKNLNEHELEVQIKSTLMLYLLSLNLPYIRFNTLKLFKTKENHISLKITLTDNYTINQMLTRLFIEKKSILLNSKRTKNQTFKESKHLLQQKNLILSCFFSVQNFVEIENLFNRIFFGINSNEFLMKIFFVFNNSSKKIINYQNLIKNYPLFWII
jgi:hypothetical protein